MRYRRFRMWLGSAHKILFWAIVAVIFIVVAVNTFGPKDKPVIGEFIDPAKSARDAMNIHLTDVAPTPTGAATTQARSTKQGQVKPATQPGGQLGFTYSVNGCRPAPTAEEQNRIVFFVSISASGGNGVYEYSFDNAGYQSSNVLEVPWTSGLMPRTLNVRSGEKVSSQKLSVTAEICP